jgi:hypothetical protein
LVAIAFASSTEDGSVLDRVQPRMKSSICFSLTMTP